MKLTVIDFDKIWANPEAREKFHQWYKEDPEERRDFWLWVVLEQYNREIKALEARIKRGGQPTPEEAAQEARERAFREKRKAEYAAWNEEQLAKIAKLYGKGGPYYQGGSYEKTRT